MDLDPPPLSTPAKRGRFEIRTIVIFVLAVIICGAVWVGFKGSPTRNRAGIDSSSNPTSTLAPRTKTTPTAP